MYAVRVTLSSGYGTALWARYETREEARAVVAQLKSEGRKARIVEE